MTAIRLTGMIQKTFSFLFVLSWFLGCVPSESSECRCLGASAQGSVEIACGSSQCLGPDAFTCSAEGSLQIAQGAKACANALAEKPPACEPKKTCDRTCGSMPDGCGGTLNCGTCAAGQVCNPTAGICEPDACTQAQAVCGIIKGQNCGTCPSPSVCASTQQACIEKVATFPVNRNVFNAAKWGNSIFVTLARPGGLSTQADLISVNLETKATQTWNQNPVQSKVHETPNAIYWMENGKNWRLPLGAQTPTEIPGLLDACVGLVETESHIYCSNGGNPRNGLAPFGIDRVPLRGGIPTRVRPFVNYAALAYHAPFLFSVGTTDNWSSFSDLEVMDVRSQTPTSLASGGSLRRDFILVDADAYYFVEDASSTSSVLHRAPMSAAESSVLLDAELLNSSAKVLKKGVVTIDAQVKGKRGLWQADGKQTPRMILSEEDLHTNLNGFVDALFADGDDWLFIHDSSLYRARMKRLP